jgi:hypothetical protein
MAFTLWNACHGILHEKQENHPDIDPDFIDMAI